MVSLNKWVNEETVAKNGLSIAVLQNINYQVVLSEWQPLI